jgi:COMM domain containing 7
VDTNIRCLGKVLADVEPHVTGGMAALNTFTEEKITSFMKPIIAWLVSPGQSDLMSELTEFSKNQGIAGKVIKVSLQGLLAILKGALKRNVSPSQLEEDLVNLGLKAELAKTATSAWRLSLGDLSRSAIGQTLCINELVDMDWKFGVTASSDDVENVGNTFLQLKLVIDKGKGGGGTETVYMELSLPQFYTFLSQMEKAKSVVDYLTT